MGWKALRDHFGIDHIVQVKDGAIHIGSGWIGSIIVISPDGRVAESMRDLRSSLKRHAEAIAADPNLVARLIAEDDVFERSIAVYTWDGDRIVEDLCEKPGWPNVTHAGVLMYENTHSTDLRETVERMRSNADAVLESSRQSLESGEAELRRRRAMLEQVETMVRNIAERHPPTDGA